MDHGQLEFFHIDPAAGKCDGFKIHQFFTYFCVYMKSPKEWYLVGGGGSGPYVILSHKKGPIIYTDRSLSSLKCYHFGTPNLILIMHKKYISLIRFGQNKVLKWRNHVNICLRRPSSGVWGHSGAQNLCRREDPIRTCFVTATWQFWA